MFFYTHLCACNTSLLYSNVIVLLLYGLITYDMSDYIDLLVRTVHIIYNHPLYH